MNARITLLAILVLSIVSLPGCTDDSPDVPAATVGDVADERSAAALTPNRPDTKAVPPERPDLRASPPLTAEDAPEPPPGGAYLLTSETYIGFIGTKPLGRHFGQFPVFDGSVTLDGDDIESAQIALNIDVTAIQTDDTSLTGTLKQDNWFDVGEHPQATFKSTKIEKSEEEDRYDVTGELTMKGMAKQITFPANITFENGVVAADAKFTIDRNQWKIGTNLKDMVVYDNVQLEIEAEARPAAPGE